MTWIQLTPEEARGHKLYGVKGWLLAFLIIWVLGAIVGVAQAFMGETLAMLYGDNAGMARALVILSSGLGLAVTVLGFMKHPLFGKLIIPFLILSQVFSVATIFLFNPTFPEEMVASGAQMPEMTPAMLAPGLIAGLVFTGLLARYFWASNRVNVTYRNRVKAEPLPPV